MNRKSDGTGRGEALVVEDDPFVGSLVSSQLSTLGFRATLVPTAEEALALLAGRDEGEQPGTLLADLHLGDGMRGDELLDELERRGWCPTRVLMSGDDPVTDLPVVILRKPFSMRTLSEALKLE
jgi:CheY-like chemotaxis protein